MKTFLSRVGSVVMGVLVIVAVIGGCALYQRGKDLLPGPARAVLDSFDSAGTGGFSPLGFSTPSSDGPSSPLDACPDYAVDVDSLGRATQGDLTPESTGGAKISDLLQAQIDRLQAGGTPDALSATGVDAALTRQDDFLTGAAARIRAASFTTTEVQSLSVSLAAALDAVADANTRFLAGGTGVRTRSAWVNWATRAQGPTDQIQAIARALGKCP